jgi:hypothetical protein
MFLKPVDPEEQSAAMLDAQGARCASMINGMFMRKCNNLAALRGQSQTARLHRTASARATVFVSGKRIFEPRDTAAETAAARQTDN